MPEPRILSQGDRIAAYPCEVTIDRLASTLAYGRCASCEVEHVIDRHNYERGHGPWNPAAGTAPMSEPRSESKSKHRPFRHLCSEAEYRDSLTDAEFWDHVAGNLAPPRTWDYGPSVIDLEDQAELAHISDPCPECGVWGACAYDSEGRALIHVTTEDTDG